MALVAFATLGLLAIILAGVLITRRNPVAAAILLICDFVVLAALYGLLDAHFAAAAQIIVYAGAIMVVFVFIMMMLNIPKEEMRFGRMSVIEWLIAFVGLSAAFAVAFASARGRLIPELSSANSGLLYPETENTRNIAASLFTDHLWAFELAGVLLLVAIIAAVAIAKSRRTV